MSKLTKSFALVALLVLLDQAVKLWIKMNFTLGQEIEILPRVLIHFTENYGMAFGLQWGGIAGKITLTLFRISAVVLLGWYLSYLARTQVPQGYMASVALVMAGAIGNIVDSTLYGLIFSESTYYQVATLFPPEGGYAPLLQGKVVDMVYLPFISTDLPAWFPVWGGAHFQFFQHIFNLADASITLGVFFILVFYRKTLKEQQNIEFSLKFFRR